MLHEIKLLLPKTHMQKLVLSAFLILLLVPFSQAFSQEYSDNTATLSVSLRNETPFVYQDSEGYTIVVGVVENNNSLASITNVIIHVNFFDDFNPNPLEVVNGHTTLQVIPPNGYSPFAIRSETANPAARSAGTRCPRRVAHRSGAGSCIDAVPWIPFQARPRAAICPARIATDRSPDAGAGSDGCPRRAAAGPPGRKRQPHSSPNPWLTSILGALVREDMRVKLVRRHRRSSVRSAGCLWAERRPLSARRR